MDAPQNCVYDKDIACRRSQLHNEISLLPEEPLKLWSSSCEASQQRYQRVRRMNLRRTVFWDAKAATGLWIHETVNLLQTILFQAISAVSKWEIARNSSLFFIQKDFRAFFSVANTGYEMTAKRKTGVKTTHHHHLLCVTLYCDFPSSQWVNVTYFGSVGWIRFANVQVLKSQFWPSRDFKNVCLIFSRLWVRR